jgi:hypothetical protein
VIVESRGHQRRESTRQALVRHVGFFMSQHHEGSTLFDLEMLIRRLSAELEALGKDGLLLTERIQLWRDEIASARHAGADRVPEGAWTSTLLALTALRHDPFGDKVPMTLIAEPPASSSDLDISVQQLDTASQGDSEAEEKTAKDSVAAT